MRRKWVAAKMESGGTYDTGTAMEFRTLYSDFTPVETFLCSACYEPRAAKVRRSSILQFLGGIVGGVLALAVSYNVWFWSCLVPGNTAPELSAWQVIIGLLAALIGFVAIKLVAWGELSLGVMWRTDNPRVSHWVLFSYALTKSKALGRDTALSLDVFESMQRKT